MAITRYQHAQEKQEKKRLEREKFETQMGAIVVFLVVLAGLSFGTMVGALTRSHIYIALGSLISGFGFLYFIAVVILIWGQGSTASF